MKIMYDDEFIDVCKREKIYQFGGDHRVALYYLKKEIDKMNDVVESHLHAKAIIKQRRHIAVHIKRFWRDCSSNPHRNDKRYTFLDKITMQRKSIGSATLKHIWSATKPYPKATPEDGAKVSQHNRPHDSENVSQNHHVQGYVVEAAYVQQNVYDERGLHGLLQGNSFDGGNRMVDASTKKNYLGRFFVCLRYFRVFSKKKVERTTGRCVNFRSYSSPCV